MIKITTSTSSLLQLCAWEPSLQDVCTSNNAKKMQRIQADILAQRWSLHIRDLRWNGRLCVYIYYAHKNLVRWRKCVLIKRVLHCNKPLICVAKTYWFTCRTNNCPNLQSIVFRFCFFWVLEWIWDHPCMPWWFAYNKQERSRRNYYWLDAIYSDMIVIGVIKSKNLKKRYDNYYWLLICDS
jgi:hypothetical protein